MTQTVHPLYSARIWKMGNSIVFPLYKAVMEALGAKVGDLLLVRVHLPYVTFRLAVPDRILPTDNFEPAELPPTLPAARRRSLEDRQ